MLPPQQQPPEPPGAHNAHSSASRPPAQQEKRKRAAELAGIPAPVNAGAPEPMQDDVPTHALQIYLLGAYRLWGVVVCTFIIAVLLAQ
eukprot:1180029-Prorocentrum_minimum.AAC.1